MENKRMAKYIDAEELLKRLKAWKYSVEEPTRRQVTYNAAISDACSAVDATPAVDIPHWIPVTERLPEEEGQYLVSCKGKTPIEVGRFYINEDGERYFGCDWNDPDGIEAWMPLPEPYKGE